MPSCAPSRRRGTLGVDWILGGTHADEALAILAGSPARYCPFPGTIVGHPSLLRGTVESIAADAARLTALDGVYGLDLLAYRFDGDVEAAVAATVAASSGPVIAAGSVDSPSGSRRLQVWGLGLHHRERRLRGPLAGRPTSPPGARGAAHHRRGRRRSLARGCRSPGVRPTHRALPRLPPAGRAVPSCAAAVQPADRARDRWPAGPHRPSVAATRRDDRWTGCASPRPRPRARRPAAPRDLPEGRDDLLRQELDLGHDVVVGHAREEQPADEMVDAQLLLEGAGWP